MLYAKLLLVEGDVRGAVARYKLGLEQDPEVADDALGAALGVGLGPEESEVVDGRIRESWQEPTTEFCTEIDRPKVTFQHVGGMEQVKDEIRVKILYPLQHPEIYQAYGKQVGGGILMYGPPGCGKTFIARAMAGEIRRVPLGRYQRCAGNVDRSERAEPARNL